MLYNVVVDLIAEISTPWHNHEGEIVFIELLVVIWDCSFTGRVKQSTDMPVWICPINEHYEN
jgi:hypothetical protein